MQSLISPSVVMIIAFVSTSILIMLILYRLFGTKRSLFVIGLLACVTAGFLVGTDFLTGFDALGKTNDAVPAADCENTFSFNTQTIYLAALDIPEGTELTNEHFISRPFPADYLPQFYIQNAKDIIGATSTMDLMQGMVLTSDLLTR